MLREVWTCCQFEQKRCCFAEVFFENSSMQDYLLLGGESIKLASEFVQVSVDCSSSSPGCSFESGVLHEMSYTIMVTVLISCTAFNTQCTVACCRIATLYSVLQSIWCFSCQHYFLRGEQIRLTSSARKPGPAFVEILCLRK